MPLWLFWFLLGMALVAFETLIAFTFYAGAIALGAFPAAIVALAGGSVELQVAVFAVGAAVSILFIRPVARRHLEAPPAIRTGTDALLGAPAVVISEVDADGGQVRIRGGDVWTARAADPAAGYPVGTEVVVREIKGVAVLIEAGAPEVDPDP